MENGIKNPISVMLNMATQEIKQYVSNIMRNNKITPDLMIFVLESVQSDLKDMDRMQMANAINDLNIKIVNQNEVNNQDKKDCDLETCSD